MSQTILLVDNNQKFRETLAIELSLSMDATILQAGNPDEAIQLFAKNRSTIDTVVTNKKR